MYILKNALRNITRSKGRNILIGCIALVIGLSACLALSIKEAAQTTRSAGLENLSVTANISVDRQAMMESFRKEGNEEEAPAQKANMKEQMASMNDLSLSDLKKYAKAESVKDFYYTTSTSVNGSGIEAISTSQSEESNSGDEKKSMGRGMQGMSMGDFTLIGYSSYSAMIDFTDKTKTITSGDIFDETSAALECVINSELATLNDIKVNDTIILVNPSNTSETFKIKVVGIYTNSDASASNGGMNMAMLDPANQIYMSYNALQAMEDSSSKNSANTENSTALRVQTKGTYVFEDVKAYESFEEEVRELGLSDTYTVSSSDVNAYEQQLIPLNNLSTYATYFLIVILIIGGCILVVLNVYHIRERKYEIGVLAAIGMKKGKIATQFICEIFTVTILSIVIGTGVGAAISVPVTNALLETQTIQSTTQSNFKGPQGSGDMGKGMSEPGGKQVSYIKEVSSAANFTVILQLIGIGILLTIVSGGISVMSILRYEPLKILSNRE